MGLKRDWNYVKRVMRTPCANQSFGLYVETGFVAAGAAAIDVLSFGCREPLKHAAGRGQLADWFGTRNRRNAGVFGHRRPKAGGGLIPPTGKSGPSLFWGFQGLAERALFLWFLAGVAEEFYLNWTSLMYAANGCDGPYQGYCQYQFSTFIYPPGNAGGLIFAELPDCHGIISDLGHIYIPAGLTVSIGYHVECEPWAPANTPNATMSTFIEDEDTGESWGGGEMVPGRGDTAAIGFHHNVPGPAFGLRKIRITAQVSGGYVIVTGGKLDVTVSGRKVELTPLTDCFKNKAFQLLG